MSRKMKLDFTGVESFQRASEGVHACKIVSADEKQSQSGNDMLVVAFEVIKGADKTARVYENYPLMDSALWKLKGLLQAIGMKCDGKVQIDLDKLIGKTCQVTVKHEEYEGKTRARVDSVGKLVVQDDEDESEENEDFDDINAPEEEEDEKPAKAKPTQSKKPAKVEEPDDDDDWEEDEEDEEPAPKKKQKPEPKPAKKSAKKTEDDDDDWDDDDWDE